MFNIKSSSQLTGLVKSSITVVVTAGIDASNKKVAFNGGVGDFWTATITGLHGTGNVSIAIAPDGKDVITGIPNLPAPAAGNPVVGFGQPDLSVTSSLRSLLQMMSRLSQQSRSRRNSRRRRTTRPFTSCCSGASLSLVSACQRFS